MKDGKDTLLLDIRSENRSPGEPIGRFLFPLSGAGIVTPNEGVVTLRAVGGQVPLEDETVSSFDRRFKMYMNNLPIYTAAHLSSMLDNTPVAVAYGDYRQDISVYAVVDREEQPTIQLLPGVTLGDVEITLVDETNQTFSPGNDWNVIFQLSVDKSITPRIF